LDRINQPYRKHKTQKKTMKYLKLSLLFLTQSSTLLECSAFNPLPVRLPQSPLSNHWKNANPVTLSGKKSADDDFADDGDKITARTDINQFITQRTIQTFMFLVGQIRDPHTGTWIENFLGSKNLLSYHGTGAICMDTFPQWDSVFNEMLERSPDVVIVEIKTNNAGRGLSKNNPYREKEVSAHFYSLALFRKFLFKLKI
jgi:hypothetical protein